MEEHYKKELIRWEDLAHQYAFTSMGTFCWQNFLYREEYYNAKFGKEFGKYQRRW